MNFHSQVRAYCEQNPNVKKDGGGIRSDRSRNFITPARVGLYWVAGRPVEISTGEFMGDKMIGFSVIGDPYHPFVKDLYSLAELEEHIQYCVDYDAE